MTITGSGCGHNGYWRGGRQDTEKVDLLSLCDEILYYT